MKESLRVLVHVTMPQWYADKYGHPKQDYGVFADASPEEADENVEAVIHSLLGNLRDDIQQHLRNCEDGTVDPRDWPVGSL